MSEVDEDKPGAAEPLQQQADTLAETPPSSPPALREDQLQNAVAFLSHPKASGQGARAT